MCLKPGFIHCSLQGASMEGDTLLGLLLGLSCLPNEPNVGGRFFQNAVLMDDAQRKDQKRVLSEKLNKSHVSNIINLLIILGYS